MMLRIVVIALIFVSTHANAQSIKIDLGLNQIDLSLKTGVMFGKISSDANKAAGTQNFGGIIVGGIFNFDSTTNLTLFVSPEGAFDAANKSALRKGLQGGFIYHLLGGSKKVTTPLYNATITTSYSTSLGLIGKVGYFDYSIIDPKNILPPTNGSSSEASLGFDFRFDITQASSLGGQLSTLILSIPSGSENLRTSGVLELFVYWRWSI